MRNMERKIVHHFFSPSLFILQWSIWFDYRTQDYNNASIIVTNRRSIKNKI